MGGTEAKLIFFGIWLCCISSDTKGTALNIVFINKPPNTDQDLKLFKINSILLHYFILRCPSAKHNEIM